jgi:hypothetical protein
MPSNSSAALSQPTFQPSRLICEHELCACMLPKITVLKQHTALQHCCSSAHPQACA